MLASLADVDTIVAFKESSGDTLNWTPDLGPLAKV